MGDHKRERGATLIEASLVLPIMILILIGTLEIGVAFKDYLTVSHSTREGSRTGALAGRDPDADCKTVTTVMETLGTGNLDKFKGIQIFQYDPIIDGPKTGTINTWTYIGTDPYDCVNDWTIDENWPSTTRKTTFAAGSEVDIIGVRVVYTHDWLTGFPPFSGSFDVDETTITRLEPDSFE
jgi:hypothetical protein